MEGQCLRQSQTLHYVLSPRCGERLRAFWTCLSNGIGGFLPLAGLVPCVIQGCLCCGLSLSLNLVHQSIQEWMVSKPPVPKTVQELLLCAALVPLNKKRKRSLFHLYPSLAEQSGFRTRTQNKIVQLRNHLLTFIFILKNFCLRLFLNGMM